MTDPDDPLTGIDLDAWQPPAPPDGIADAVLRRMSEPVAVAAHELAERPRRRRWLWIGAGALGAAVATGALVAAPWRAAAPPVDRGDVVADRPSHVELGASSAELDGGAALSWRREHRQLSVTQLRGAVTWRVGAEDTIMIDAGAMGASVEASGASLRVEVAMRITSSDGRVIAASTITAAAVALVTVVVYQGHVKITSGGQTVNVGAGGAVELKPGEPARELRTVAAAPDPARTPVDPDALPRTAQPAGGPPKPPAAELDSAAIDRTLADAAEAIGNCLAGQRVHLTAHVTVQPDGEVHGVEVKPPGGASTSVAGACVASAIRHVRFDATERGGSFERSFDGDPAAVPTRNLPPSALEPLRIKGNRMIVPDEYVKRTIQGSGDPRLVAAVKLCVDTAGKVGSLTLLKTSGYPAYDNQILAEMKGWAFKPYVVDGKPTAVCTAVTYIYNQR